MQAQRPERTADSREIVVIDDEPDILDVLADVLRDEGYSPVVFRDGFEALDYLRDHRPSLVLSDLRLPSMSGQEFIAKLRSLHGPSLPVVVMSGAVTSDIAQTLSIQAVLLKPFELDAFLALVNRWARSQ